MFEPEWQALEALMPSGCCPAEGMGVELLEAAPSSAARGSPKESVRCCGPAALRVHRLADTGLAGACC